MTELEADSISLDGFGLGEIEASSTLFTNLIFWRFDLAAASAETKYVQLINPILVEAKFHCKPYFPKTLSSQVVRKDDFWEIKVIFDDGHLLYRARHLSVSTVHNSASVDIPS